MLPEWPRALERTLLKRLGKRLLYFAAPGWTLALMSARARAHSHRIVAGWGGRALAEKLGARLGNRVLAGPFAGLLLSPMTRAEQVGPFLLGVYESELDDAWAVVATRRFDQIIDIGSKFGYYAVGLARLYPDTGVVAFDTDWWARKALREMVALNGVSNVEIRKECTSSWLAAQAGKASLIICDCEGCEESLFTEPVASGLQRSTLIIETHDCFIPGSSERLRRILEATHTVEVFATDVRRRDPDVPLDFLTADERGFATREVRPSQEWLLCLPKSGAPSPS